MWGQWKTLPDVIGPQGDLQLPQDQGGLLDALLKLWIRSDVLSLEMSYFAVKKTIIKKVKRGLTRRVTPPWSW